MTVRYTPTAGVYDPNDIVHGNYEDLVAETVTIKSGAGVLTRGSVLGKVTADGKYLLSAAAASDGSENPSRILASESVDASSADATAIVYRRGDFRADKLIYGAGHDATSVKTALGDDTNLMLI